MMGFVMSGINRHLITQMKKQLSIEVHIFNFDQSIYGEEVIVGWYKRIRAEQKFNGIDELNAQIEKDK